MTIKFITQQINPTSGWPPFTEGMKSGNRQDAEKTLSEMQWIEPYAAWRTLQIEGGVITKVGSMDYSKEKELVIWSDFKPMTTPEHRSDGGKRR